MELSTQVLRQVLAVMQSPRQGSQLDLDTLCLKFAPSQLTNGLAKSVDLQDPKGSILELGRAVLPSSVNSLASFGKELPK